MGTKLGEKAVARSNCAQNRNILFKCPAGPETPLPDRPIHRVPHVSPIEWDNVILYGQYVLDRARVR